MRSLRSGPPVFEELASRDSDHDAAHHVTRSELPERLRDRVGVGVVDK
ncbi:MAG: hypothetical protein VCC67_05855 [Myxococcota bacterium]